MVCMEEEAPGPNLKDKQEFAFWRDEENVLSRRDCLDQGLAFVALASSPVPPSSHAEPRAAILSYLCLSFPTWGEEL